MKTSDVTHGPLGRPITHSATYDPDQLFPIPRADARLELGITSGTPFFGEDIWNAYEISWLDSKGKPRIAMGRFRFSASTENIIESKSVKLYLNSLNQTRFESPESVAAAMKTDFSMVARGDVSVSLILPDRFSESGFSEPAGTCLDDMNIEFDQYRYDPGLLKTFGKKTEEQLYSHLLRTNCPVTGQPDWATVTIEYKGVEIDHEGLLRYLVSFREHAGFHESCVERIFTDMSRRCRPEMLTVNARFTRRGGIDINPCRSSVEESIPYCRFARQ